MTSKKTIIATRKLPIGATSKERLSSLIEFFPPASGMQALIHNIAGESRDRSSGEEPDLTTPV